MLALLLTSSLFNCQSRDANYQETRQEKDERMAWWRDARFGLFIHWGLYAIPAGEWNGETGHGEWIRSTAEIPIDTYDQFINQFNPEKFNADEWVALAKEAGMKYIVITSKHHDGFCLFDSKYTDFDVMSTPFQRDIMKELAEACRKQDIQICWYHSIMDWHHPDYLPRREWETDRSTEGADFGRFIQYLKNQLKELVHNYGEIGVLWFDGEWESTWNREYGRDLYNYVRGLQPNIIINNRVGASRSGMEGFAKGEEGAGDFGTPEQQIPATGIPGVDWETCMTMNDHWGYNKNDQNWKSTEDLIRKLADIASKGGNFLLNVGPTAEGLIPQASVDRLQAMGSWMEVNGESIYGTNASPFKSLSWGRCTRKPLENGTRLYLHVFDWPEDGKLKVPGIYSEIEKAYLLADAERKSLSVESQDGAITVTVPASAPDTINSVIVMDITGKLDVYHPPEIKTDINIFIDEMDVPVYSDRENVEIRYTTDGSDPTAESPLVRKSVRLQQSAILSAQCFRDGKPVSPVVQREFKQVVPSPAEQINDPASGVQYAYYEGEWDRLPDFSALEPIKEGVLPNFEFSPRNQVEYFGFQYDAFIYIPEQGVYVFYTDSDDGSRLYIGEELVVDNDGLHSLHEARGIIALEKGYHPIRVTFFECTGGDDLVVSLQGPNLKKQPIADDMLFYQN